MLLSKQIREVMKQAKCSAHEAAEALGVDIDASTMAEIADSGGVFTLEKIVKEGQLKAAKVLVDIIEDPAAENKDRIAASKIILLGAGELPQIGGGGYEDRFKKFAELAESYEEKNANVIDVIDHKVEKNGHHKDLAIAI
jgi:hypothetical protein